MNLRKTGYHGGEARIDNLRPLHDGVILKRIMPPAKVGLIHIPDTARQPVKNEAVIHSIGPGNPNLGPEYGVDPALKVGQRVIFDPTYRDDTHIDGQDFIRLRARFIMAIVED